MADRTGRYDVVIIGAGFAALSTAWFLRELAGVDDVCIVASRLPKGGTGLCQLGLTDHLNRVAEAIGEEDAAAIWRYSLAGIECARQLALAAGGEVSPTGSHLLATFPAEARDLERTAPLLAKHDLPGRLVDAPLDGADGRPHGLAAIENPGDLVVRPPQILRGLAQRLKLASVRLELDARVEAVTTVDGGVEVAIRGREEPVRAEVCVLAAGPWAAELHPFLRDRVIPIRAQGFYAGLRAGLEGVLSVPLTATWGHEVYMVRGATFLASGMRPDSTGDDVGFTAEPSPAFQSFLEGFARRRAPALPADLQVKGRYAWTIGLPADGLPIVGPLPGSDRLLVIAGLGFRGIALACAAGRSLARVVGGMKRDVPTLLTPRRFV